LIDNSREKIAVPGDKLGTIEEFIPGVGSAAVGDNLTATIVGQVAPDMSARVMNVEPGKVGIEALPKEGDLIIGSVQSAQSSVAQVAIKAVNDRPTDKDFTGMLSLRDDRRRRSSPVKPGDTIRAMVFSTKNSIFHLTLDAPNCGVLFTVCSVCGGSVVAMGRDRVKCRECGTVDERMLADDFVKLSRSQPTL
jgi:exosome complex component CSL4